MDVLKIILPFFHTPRNYSEVLTKLASFAFWDIYAITFVLRFFTPVVEREFSRIEAWGPIGVVLSQLDFVKSLNPLGFLIALFVALLSSQFHLHDKISDLLGLRRRFDHKHILMPLARKVGSAVSEDKVRKARDQLMRAVYYQYASSSAPAPLVDRHDIEQALSAWTWFWVLVEATTYLGIAVVAASVFASKDMVIGFAIGGVSCSLLALLQCPRLSRYARPQVDAIARNGAASREVRSTFDAL